MEGLVHTLPNKGVKVASLSAKDLFQLFEARESIETRFLERSAQALKPADFKRLREGLLQAGQALASARTPQEAEAAGLIYLAADRNMHDELVNGLRQSGLGEHLSEYPGAHPDRGPPGGPGAR